MNKYEDIAPISKQKADDIFINGEVEQICNAMVAISLHEKDWRWAQDKILALFESKNDEISGLAATCLGHIARIQRRIDKEKVIEKLGSRINEVGISGRIKDALEDIQTFT